jgi:hypothetical protein
MGNANLLDGFIRLKAGDKVGAKGNTVRIRNPKSPDFGQNQEILHSRRTNRTVLALRGYFPKFWKLIQTTQVPG